MSLNRLRAALAGSFAYTLLFAAPSLAETVADSVADWSATGTQGEKGWFYGYYNLTLDGNGTYAPAEFIAFRNTGGPVSPDGNHWTGSAWDLLAAASGPWTSIDQEGTHPNGTNSAPNEEHWTIRRWVSDREVPQAEITWEMRKTNPNGGGVTGHLFLNGVELDRATIAGGDTLGVRRTVLADIAPGDRVDLALTPEDAGGSRGDGSDGSANRLTIDDGIDDPDGDGLNTRKDNCPTTANPGQEDGDGDGVGDACDNCPETSNTSQRDRDRDGIGDACDKPPPKARVWDVVIHEIHYNPSGGSGLEFVELFNAAASSVDVGGWAFTEGIRVEIPQGTEIPAGGYLVLAGQPAILAEEFSLPQSAIIGWIGSTLDNGGETLVLVDRAGAVVDSLRYDDDPPWDTDADGGGPSLQRVCAAFDSEHPANWTGQAGEEPTPMAANVQVQCPPPALPPPAIAIHEIFYHPPSLDELTEFVELTNTTAAPIDLDGYCFTQGFDFCFEGAHVLAPGGFLVVCRNEAAARAAFGITNTAGDWVGQLSNDGERITLVDAAGRLADSVRYDESGDWNIGADGLGFSLEKIVPRATSDDPASWTDSGAADIPPAGSDWQTVTVSGNATSNTIYFYIESVGEFLIDDVRLADSRDPDVNILPASASTFDSGIAGWDPRGTHSTSGWTRDGSGPLFGEPALHLVATGAGTGSSNSVAYVLPSGTLDLSTSVTYQLSFRYLHVSGSSDLVARLSVSTPNRGIYWSLESTSQSVVTPGVENNAHRELLPPFVSTINRSPKEPTSTDWTTITLRVSGGEASEVKLIATLPAGVREFEMLDDGLSGDGIPSDGVYGADVPPQPHNTVVLFKVEVRGEGGVRLFPPRTDTEEYYAYYVNDDQPDSVLPIWTLVVPSSNASSWISALDRTYREFHLAVGGDIYYNAEIRRRGGSVYGATKRFLKVKFNKGHLYEGQRRMNLQSLWTDKSLIRERMTWEVFGEMANPPLRHEFARMHANGAYYGLYALMEQPDEQWLERLGMNDQGDLYKATASREERNGTYEKKTNDESDYTNLRAFLNELHDTNTASGLRSFFRRSVFEDAIIDYQAAQVLINNRDYPHKNHYLYHDTERGRWMVTGWDLDLAFGKRWDGSFGGVYNDLMDNPGITPWYTTQVNGGGTGNHLLDRFFHQAGTYYRRAYIVRLWDAIHEKYPLEFYEAKIGDFRELLIDEQAEDIARWGRTGATSNDPTAPAAFEPNLDRVMEHIRIRRGYLINYLRSTEGFTGHDRLMLTEVMYNPLGSDDAEFLELWNNSGRAIDVSSWTIEGVGTTNVDGSRSEFSFPAGTVVAADEVFIVAKDPVIFEVVHGRGGRVFGPYPGNLDNGREELRVKDDGPGYPATVDIVRYDDEAPWPVRADGLGYSLELFDIYEDINNDWHGPWRASLNLHGSPWFIHRQGDPIPLFVRGNCNGDQTVDISDAVTILFYLFLERPQPACIDGCDVDGSETVDISDAIGLLQSMFRPGSFVIPAPAPGQCLPAREGFCERSNCVAG